MVLLLSASLLSFLASVTANTLADAFLSERIAIAGSWIGLERALNRGIAFSLEFPFQEVAILLALLLVVLWAVRARGDRVQSLGFGLIIGGALSNIANRLADGFVTDYVQIGSFPVFNLADSCITAGVAVLLFRALYSGPHGPHLHRPGRSGASGGRRGQRIEERGAAPHRGEPPRGG